MTQLSPPRSRPSSRPRQGFTAWRDAPSALWLAAAVLVSLVHPFVDGSRWLMVHLVLLGALTHAAMVWSSHFSQALLKTGPAVDPVGNQRARALLLSVGVAGVLTGVVVGPWVLAAASATLVAGAVCWHGAQLWRRLRASLAPRFRITVGYYVTAAAWVPIGATFGVLLARGPDDVLRGRLLIAHTAALLLGWIGLTVTGTLVTFWPTLLRTKIDPRAEALARRALPVLFGATVIVVAAAAAGYPRVAGVAVLGWVMTAGWWGRAVIAAARRRPPQEFASLSVAAALGWAVLTLLWTGTALLVGTAWSDLAQAHGPLTGMLVVGFAAQLLIGALSYLVPVVLGGGPAAVRTATAHLGRFAVLRLVLVNAGLGLALAPVPSVVRIILTTLVLTALTAFLPLLGLAIRASLRERTIDRASTRRVWTDRAVWSSRQLVAGVSALGLAVAVGIVADPLAAGISPRPGAGGSAQAAVQATGRTTTVQVSAAGMRFHPASVTVPAGDRLIIELTNTDPTTTHDLVLDTGVRSPRLAPDRSATIDVGVVGAGIHGWCSLVGHRQMGMTFTILVDGAPAPGAGSPAAESAPTGHGGHVDLQAEPAPDFTAVDATLPALPAAPPGTEHRVTLTVEETLLQVAPGVWQNRWTYNGQVPGPTLRGRIGDVFVVTLVNAAGMGHSIDFHAGSLAPDEPMRTIPPGQSLTYRFTATHAGIWMYHCSTMPMSAHIAAGMHGAVVIDPPDLPPVDREYLLVQSEAYLGADHSQHGAAEVDAAKVSAETPDAVVFNGVAGQYDHRPLTAKVGERVRFWVLDAGPNRPSAFHIVGGQFDTVYLEGAWTLRPTGTQAGGSQVLGLHPAQGGFVELTFPEPGHYPLVSHLMVDAERGAHGIVEVSG